MKWQHISHVESTKECIEKVKKRGFRVLVTDFDNEKANRLESTIGQRSQRL